MITRASLDAGTDGEETDWRAARRAKWRLSFLLTLAMPLTIPAAQAAVDEAAAPLNRSVRLGREAVGCGTFAELWRMTNITVQQGGDAALTQMAEHGCRLFKSFHGEVIDTKDGALCILGIGNSRCLWFAPGAFEPTMGSDAVLTMVPVIEGPRAGDRVMIKGTMIRIPDPVPASISRCFHAASDLGDLAATEYVLQTVHWGDGTRFDYLVPAGGDGHHTFLEVFNRMFDQAHGRAPFVARRQLPTD